MKIEKIIQIKVDKTDADKSLSDLDKAIKKTDKTATDLNSTFEDVYGDIKPLTGRLGELEDRLYELANAGDTTSKEFKDLSAEVARMRKVQMDTDATTDALAQTTSQKLGGSMQFVAGAMETTVGAMAALGVESKEGEKAIEGVVGAMAVTDGLQTMNESVKSVKSLGAAIKASTIFQKAATKAQMIYNAVMNANPIGAIVLAVTALIAAGYALIKMFKASSEATQNLNAELDKQDEALKNVEAQQAKNNKSMSDSQKHQIALMKAQGKTTEEIRKQERANAANAIAMAEAQVASNKLLKAEQERALWLAKNNGDEEQIERAEENLKKAQDILKKSIEDKNKAHQDRIALTKRYEIEDAQIITDSEKKKEQHRIQKAEERRKKEQEEKEKKQKEEEDRKAKEAQAEAERIAKEQEAERNRLDAIKDIQDEYKTRQEDIDADTELKQIELEEQRRLEELERLKASEEAKLQVIQFYEERKKEATEKSATQKKKEEERIEAERAAAIEENYKSNLENIQNILSVGGKSMEKVSKAIAIADVVRSSYKSISETVSNIGIANAKAIAANPLTGGQPFVTANTIKGALQIGSTVASGLKSIQAIKGNAKSVNAGVGNIASGRSGVGSQEQNQPAFNLVGRSNVNQLQTGLEQQETAPVQAFVVSTSVTTQQEADRATEGQAAFG